MVEHVSGSGFGYMEFVCCKCDTSRWGATNFEPNNVSALNCVLCVYGIACGTENKKKYSKSKECIPFQNESQSIISFFSPI